MNKFSINPGVFFKRVLTVLFSVSAVFVFQMLAFSYLLIKIPNFETYYVYLPWAVTFFTALFLSFVSKSFGSESLLISVTSSIVLTFVVILVGVIIGTRVEDLPMILARLVVFVIGSSFLTLYLSKMKKSRRTAGKKFRYSK